MIDGTANIDTSIGTPAAVLSVDAIQEFKEQTTTYSAEYGFSSNQINLVSKTGTNALHGTGFGFFRNDAWDARNFFDDKTAPAPLLDQKQFGFVVGGPVMLPGYDGRNRTFFLVNYEGTRIDRGATNFYTVPTPEELTGRFNTPIIDPVTGAPFPNNTIPQSRFSRLAQLAIRNNWFPAPNTSAAQGNYQAVRTFPQVQDQFTVRGDQDLARFGRVFFRYTNTSYENTTAVEPDRGRQPGVRAGHATTGRSPTAGRFGTRSSTSSGWAAWTRARISTAFRARRQTWTSSM